MHKVFRIISTIILAVGLGYVLFYMIQRTFLSGEAILNQPSYYVRQNFLYVFFCGVIILIAAVAASFMSWLKSMEPKVEILENAGYVDEKVRQSWVEGSSLDQNAGNRQAAAAPKKVRKVKQPRQQFVPQIRTDRIFCMYCGAEMSPDAKFCEMCGQKNEE